MEKNNTRIIYISLLNILACICVVAMHCNSITHTYDGSYTWMSAMLVDTVCYWAVPVFVMISGVTLMDYREKYDTRTFFKKRFVKTLIPYILWSLFFLVLKLITGRIVLEELSVSYVIDAIINSKAQGVYWFFPVLFAVYLSIPVISLIPKEKRKKVFLYMAIYAVAGTSIIPICFHYLGITWNTAFNSPISGGYLIFVLLGYLLHHTELKKVHRIALYLLGIAGAVVRFVTTVRLSSIEEGLYKGYWGYTNICSVLLGMAVFVWFKYRDWSFIEKNKKLPKMVNLLAGASFGVYLIHKLFVTYLPKIFGIDIRGWQWRTIGVIGVYCVSVVVVLIIKKIKVLRNIVP